MSESILRSMALDFAVQILTLVKDLKQRGEGVIANQIGRSGTSIGANLFEAQYAQGKADFVSKLQIALKETAETGFWLELLFRTNVISLDNYKSLDATCTNIRVMLVSSVRTMKKDNDPDSPQG